MERALAASIPAEAENGIMHWMVPSTNRAERAGLLQGMPAEVFQVILATIQPYLGKRDPNKLLAALAG